MINYYKRTLIRLFESVQDLADEPWRKRYLVKPIQETLIEKIVYIERRIRYLKRYNKKQRRYLKEKRATPLSKEEAAKLKSEIEDSTAKIKDYQRIVHIFRTIGDAIAFIYMSKWDIKQFAAKEAPGSLSGKSGFKLEKQILRRAFELDRIAILHDITNCLRHGDITVISKDIPPIIFEVKSSHYRNKRAQRQKQEIDKILDFIKTDRKLEEETNVFRYAPAQEERNHEMKFNRLLKDAMLKGTAIEEVERGLFYYVEENIARKGFRNFLSGMKDELIISYVNPLLYISSGYYPFTLSIHDPIALFKLYSNELHFFVVIEEDNLIEKVNNQGLDIQFEDSEDWAFTIRREPIVEDRLEQLTISRHFFLRTIGEFMSLDWLIEELISQFQNSTIEELISSVDD